MKRNWKRIFILPLYSFANNGLISGRQDGNVMMRNNRTRAMRMPANPQTPAQTTQRGNLGSLSGSWNTLTDAQRISWNALTLIDVDRLGHTFTVTGKDAYVKLNRNLFNAGQTLLTTAPTPTSPLGISSLSFVADVSLNTMVITFTPTPVPADTTWLVYGTAGMSVGTYRPNPSLYKLFLTLPAATATGGNIRGAWSAVHGPLVVDTKIFLKFVAVKNTTGFVSPATIASSIVVA